MTAWRQNQREEQQKYRHLLAHLINLLYKVQVFGHKGATRGPCCHGQLPDHPTTLARSTVTMRAQFMPFVCRCRRQAPAVASQCEIAATTTINTTLMLARLPNHPHWLWHEFSSSDSHHYFRLPFSSLAPPSVGRKNALSSISFPLFSSSFITALRKPPSPSPTPSCEHTKHNTQQQQQRLFRLQARLLAC